MDVPWARTRNSSGTARLEAAIAAAAIGSERDASTPAAESLLAPQTALRTRGAELCERSARPSRPSLPDPSKPGETISTRSSPGSAGKVSGSARAAPRRAAPALVESRRDLGDSERRRGSDAEQFFTLAVRPRRGVERSGSVLRPRR